MSEWPPWSVADPVGLSRYVVPHLDRLLGSLDRYQFAAGPGGPLAVARAIYDHLAGRGIAYDLESFHPSDALQIIRTPVEVVFTARRATCLDAALLYAGMLMAYELLPVVVVLDGHAVTLVSRVYGKRDWQTRGGADLFINGPLTDPEAIRRLVASGDFAAVECTGFTRVLTDPTGELSAAQRHGGVLPFDQAVEAGRRALLAGDRTPRFAIDIAAAWYGWRIDPYEFNDSPIAAEVDEWVLPHGTMLADLRNRPRFLLSSQLGFVSPGKDHPTAPANILRRLTEAAEPCVLLTGQAGAGKTRTCIEVAILADKAGWRVLHVQANGQLTNAHLEAAILRDPTARTLLILDYLDLCGGLDIPQLLVKMFPRVAAGSGRLALLGTSRPGQLGAVLAHGGQQTFEQLTLRQDTEYQEEIAGRIVHQVARKATAALGKPEMIEICGRRPIITLLIAQDVKRALDSGQTVRTGPGRGQLMRWLHKRFVLDGLVEEPADDVAGPLHDKEPRPVLLASALITAVCPLPQPAIEALVQPVLDTSTARKIGARRLIDTLRGMGWLDQAGDNLVVAHDIITDQFLVEAISPQSEVRLFDDELRTLLDTLLTTPVALDHAAGNVARLHGDHIDSGAAEKASQLERTCVEWIGAHAAQLGTAFAESPDGGHALYTLLHAAPWQAAVSSHWDAIVEPWLHEQLRDSERITFLSYALRALPTADAQPIIMAALVWLAGHHDDLSAEQVLGPLLLRRDDLKGDERAHAVAHALAWLKAWPSRGEAAFVLPGLLVQTHRAPSGAEAVEVALGWLANHAGSAAADFVLRMLLSHSDLRGPAVLQAIEFALHWAREHSTTNRAPYVLRPLMDRAELRGEARSKANDLAMGWLREHGTSEGASYLLRPLLDGIGGLSPQYRAEVLKAADSWLAAYPGHWSGSFVLPALLVASDQTLEEVKQRIRQSLRWLEVQPTEPDSSFVIRPMIASLAHQVGRDLRSQVVSAALAWLGVDPSRPGAGYVLGELLRCDALDAALTTEICAVGINWLDVHAGHDSADYVIQALLKVPSQHDPAAGYAFAWLDAHPDHAHTNYVIQALLKVPDQHDPAAGYAFAWLDTHPDHDAANFVIQALLPLPAHADRAAEYAFAWLDAHPDHDATDYVIQALLKVPSQHDPAAGYAFAWLDAHPDHDVTYFVIQALLPLPAHADRAAEYAFAWLSAHPDHDAANYVIQAVLKVPSQHDPAAEYAFAWLDAHPDHDAANYVIQAVLKVPSQHDPAAGYTFAWLDAHPDHDAANFVIQALLPLPAHADRAAEYAFAWLDTHPDHDNTNYVIRDLLPLPGHADRAAALAFAWLDTHPDHPATNYVIRDLLPLPAHADRAAEYAFTWLDTHPDHDNTNYVIRDLLPLPEHADRAAALAFAWLDTHPDHPATNYVIQALLKVPGQRDQAAALALAWLDTHLDHPATNYVIRDLLPLPAHADRAAEHAFAWLETHPDHPGTNYVLQTLLKGAGPRDPAAGYAFAWLDTHPDHDHTNYVIQALLPLPAHADRAAEHAFTWLDTHPDHDNTNYVIRDLLPLPAHADRAAEHAFTWLDTHPDHDNTNYVIQALLPLPAHADRAAEYAFAWLDTHPDHDAAAFIARTLLQLPGQVELATRVAYGWLDVHRGRSSANLVIRALLDSPEQTDQAIGVAVAWLERHPHHESAPLILHSLLRPPAHRTRTTEWAHDRLDAGYPVEQLVDTGATSDVAGVRVVELALVWAQGHPEDPGCARILRATIERRTVRAPDRAAIRAGLACIAQHPEHPCVDDVISALLDATGFAGARGRKPSGRSCTDDDAARIVAGLCAVADESGLSGRPAFVIRRAVDIAAQWLVMHADAPGAVDLALALLGCDETQTAQLTVCAEVVIAALDAAERDDAMNVVIRRLLRNDNADTAMLQRAAGRGLAWLGANQGHPVVPEAHEALLGCRVIDPSVAVMVADSALAWLDAHPDDHRAVRVIQALLACRHLDEDHYEWAAVEAFAWIDRNLGDPAIPTVLGAVLAQGALDSEHTARAAATWLATETGV
ncbi:hypothetical protein [Dactylosporangium aurantiacum]|uniref:hypothetical protein n=1 Tax=Dactylosporangium aurantiacum TaxID=35754 RepID=UPI0036AEB987